MQLGLEFYEVKEFNFFWEVILISKKSLKNVSLAFLSTVKPLTTNTSKEFVKCRRIVHFLIMECCRNLVFLIMII